MKYEVNIDLENEPLSKVISISVELSGKDREEIAEDLQKKKSTVYRYLNPNDCYSIPLFILPKLCKSLGNNILIEWLCAQIGGRLTFLEDVEKNTESTLTKMHSGLHKEFGEFLIEYSKSIEDGEVTPDEAKNMLKELNDVVSQISTIKENLTQIIGSEPDVFKKK